MIATYEESLYAELKREIERHGLLRPQPFYYGYKTALALFMILSAWAILLFVDQTWIKIVSSLYLSFATTQFCFIGHDAGHRQVFSSARKNDLLGLMSSFFVGVSYFWWMDTHNKHHSKPNQTAFDPAVDYSVLAFSREDANGKSAIGRFIMKHQAWFFIPLMCLYPISIRIDSIRYILQNKYKFRFVEAVLMAVHFFTASYLLFTAFSLPMGLLFLVIHQTLFGLYLASVFVPNHMGMIILEDNANMDFLRHQVITARNIKGREFVEFLFGGLNYQIEHHLFPKMARNRLKKAKKIVEEFCRERSIQYYETSFLQSFREIFSYLHQVSIQLRSA